MGSDDKSNPLIEKFIYVDSQLPCGLDGGTVKYSGSKASAKYGIGYWDAQLPMTSGTLTAR